MQIRIGQGTDIHRLVDGRPLILGGVKIPYAKGLLGHSDADVLTHSLIDALLGAAGREDIGTFFPDTDQKWKDADSIVMLKGIWEMLKKDGWSIVNADSNLFLEEPRLKPYISKIRETVCAALGIEPSQYAVKAGTMEKLGFVGRGEGILAQTVVLISR